MTDSLRPAVFLDRDGTINEEKEYLWKVEEFNFIPGAPEAIRLLNSADFLVVVVTNQSGIGRGYYGVSDLEKLHRFMDQELTKTGAVVDAYYFCPHHPLHGLGEYGADCECRKPFPGMLWKAAREMGINLAGSWMIGDKMADVEAGLAAGCRPVLVRTGYGNAAVGTIPADIPVMDDLLDAARFIVGRE